MFAVVERESGLVVGFSGLAHPGGQAEPEIKYALRREFWGRGLATEVVCAMLAYAASAFRMVEVIATISPENSASHSVLEQAGMEWRELLGNEDGSTTRLYAWRSSEKGV